MVDANLGREKTNRILVIHTDGNTYNNPSLKCLFDLLLENGYTIDLRYPSSYAPMPAVNNVRLLPYGKLIGRFKRIIFNRLCSRFLMVLSVLLETFFYYKKYDLIVGVDRQGLLEANILNQLRNTPYIYISFEISFADETSDHFKAPERIAARNVSRWIVQDESRAKALKQENDLDDSKEMLLPLASAGIGHASQERLRDILAVPNDKKVAIVVGSISKWAMTKEIIQSVVNWPDSWVLIVHERYGRTSQVLADELDEVKSLIGDKIFISDNASEMVDDMSMILSGVDAGLGLYNPDYETHFTGKNLKILGLASGKISTYLRYGVPVIANEIGLYASEIRKNRIGAIVNDLDEIPNALIEIENRDFSQDIDRYYSEHLDFNVHADSLLAMVKSVINSR